MPAVLAFQYGLVPGYRPRIRLVRIDEQPRRAIRRAQGRNGDAIGALRFRFGHGLVDFAKLSVEAVEERSLEHETRSDIAPGYRQKPARDFLRVQRRIVVHAVSIGVEYVLHTERQFAVVFPVDGVPHAHQPDEIIRYGCFAAFYRRELAARGERRFLDGGEIVFAMGEGQTERDIGIPLAKDMRHAEIIALDADVILRGFGDENAIIRFARLGEPIERDQPAERQKRQADQKRQSDFEIPHDFPELATPARLERATPSLEGWCSIQLSYGARPDGPDSNSDGFARASMAPGDFPVEAEIVGIGLGDGLGSVGLEDLKSMPCFSA